MSLAQLGRPTKGFASRFQCEGCSHWFSSHMDIATHEQSYCPAKARSPAVQATPMARGGPPPPGGPSNMAPPAVKGTHGPDRPGGPLPPPDAPKPQESVTPQQIPGPHHRAPRMSRGSGPPLPVSPGPTNRSRATSQGDPGPPPPILTPAPSVPVNLTRLSRGPVRLSSAGSSTIARPSPQLVALTTKDRSQSAPPKKLDTPPSESDESEITTALRPTTPGPGTVSLQIKQPNPDSRETVQFKPPETNTNSPLGVALARTPSGATPAAPIARGGGPPPPAEPLKRGGPPPPPAGGVKKVETPAPTPAPAIPTPVVAAKPVVANGKLCQMCGEAFPGYSALESHKSKCPGAEAHAAKATWGGVPNTPATVAPQPPAPTPNVAVKRGGPPPPPSGGIIAPKPAATAPMARGGPPPPSGTGPVQKSTPPPAPVKAVVSGKVCPSCQQSFGTYSQLESHKAKCGGAGSAPADSSSSSYSPAAKSVAPPAPQGGYASAPVLTAPKSNFAKPALDNLFHGAGFPTLPTTARNPAKNPEIDGLLETLQVQTGKLVK